jgi:signal transduction histidine kinase
MENASMINSSRDDRWTRLLSLSVHEFRTPMTVVAGYIRMLLKDRAGALNDQQRRLLEEAEKSCARLSALLAEMSDLSNLEDKSAPFNRGPIELRTILSDVIATLPEVPDRPITVDLSTVGGSATVQADPVRLKTAFTSLLIALRRELVASTKLFVRERSGKFQGKPASWIAFADADHIAELETATPERLTTFNEWRGGCGLSLPVARRIIEGHGGAIWSPSEGALGGAVVVLPHM